MLSRTDLQADETTALQVREHLRQARVDDRCLVVALEIVANLDDLRARDETDGSIKSILIDVGRSRWRAGNCARRPTCVMEPFGTSAGATESPARHDSQARWRPAMWRAVAFK